MADVKDIRKKGLRARIVVSNYKGGQTLDTRAASNETAGQYCVDSDMLGLVYAYDGDTKQLSLLTPSKIITIPMKSLPTLIEELAGIVGDIEHLGIIDKALPNARGTLRMLNKKEKNERA